MNSPPPEAWRSAKPVFCGNFWPVFTSSWIVSRAEVPRQTLGQLWIDIPNQYRRVRIGRPHRRILLHERGREAALRAMTSKTDSIYRVARWERHRDSLRAPIALAHFRAGKKFLAILRTRNWLSLIANWSDGGRTHSHDAAVSAAAGQHSCRHALALSIRRFLRAVF